MKITSLAVIVSIFTFLNVYSQNESESKIGVFGGLNANFHTIEIKELSNTPTCNSCYESKGGNGLSLGLIVDFPILKSVSISIKCGYAVLDGTFQKEFTQLIVMQDGSPELAIFSHNIDSRVHEFFLEPTFSVNVIENFYLEAGMRLGRLAKSDFVQEERLVSPINATFTDGSRVRNVYSGDLPDVNKSQAGIILGACYELNFGEESNFAITPYGSYYFGLTDLTNSLNWKVNSLQFGLAFKILIADSAISHHNH